jgi:hypothetical protein
MKTLVSALILSASFIGAAQAGELGYPPAYDLTASAVSRADVLDALRDARAQGQIPQGEAGVSHPAVIYSAGTNDRADVLADLARARAQGRIGNGELDRVSTPS